MKLHHLEEFYPSQLGEAMKCYFLEKRKCYQRILVKSSTHCARERKGECTFLQTLKHAGVKSEFYYTISRCTKSGSKKNDNIMLQCCKKQNEKKKSSTKKRASLVSENRDFDSHACATISKMLVRTYRKVSFAEQV